MRIAIPTFGQRISPRFDCAPEFMFVEVNDQQIVDRQVVAAVDWAPRRRVARLIEMGVETVICGGIDRFSDARLRAEGVEIYSWQTGPVEAALTRLLEGKLEQQPLPRGCGRGQGHRFRGGRCRGAS